MITVSTAAAALQEVGRLSHVIVISGIRMPDMDYTDLADCLPKYFELLLMDTRQNVSHRRQPGLVAVTMPVRIPEFVNTVRMMLENMDRQVSHAGKKRQQRSERARECIQEAKYMLMERNHLTEEEAYRYIQKNSMDTGRTMTETAQMILTLAQ